MTTDNENIENEQFPVEEEAEMVQEVPEEEAEAIFDDVDEDNSSEEPELKEDEVLLDFNEEEAIDMVDLDQLGKTLPLASCSIEEATAKLAELRTTLSKKELYAQVIDPDSAFNILVKHINDLGTSDEFFFDSFKRAGEHMAKYVSDNIRLVDAVPIPGKSHKGKVVSGDMADKLIQAKKKNIKFIYLYNSGVRIMLRGPSLNELNTLYNRMNDSTVEYGAELGSYFYIHSDVVVKRCVVDMFLSLVLDSTVKNWKKGNNLLKAISVHDYPTILWGMGCLIYKDGYEFTNNCVSPDGCTYTEVMKVDPKVMRRNCYGLMPEKCIEFINSNAKRSLAELSQYRDDLELTKKFRLYDSVYGVAQVPTLYEYLNFGEKFNAAILNTIHSDKTPEEIQKALNYNYYKLFAIWLSEVQMKEEDSPDAGNDFIINDLKNIASTLDISQLEDSNFGVEMDSFIKETAITHIVIPYSKCPACGHVPSRVIDGYIPFDVQKHFFTTLVMRLAQNI